MPLYSQFAFSSYVEGHCGKEELCTYNTSTDIKPHNIVDWMQEEEFLEKQNVPYC